MNNYQVLFLMILLLFSSSVTFGQEVFVEQFTEKDGLPSMTTYEIIQDSSGVLWFGTEEGLVSYDGIEFETYVFPQLKDNDILELFIYDGKHIGFENFSKEFCLINEDTLLVNKIDDSPWAREIYEVEGENFRFNSVLSEKGIEFLIEKLALDKDSLFFEEVLFLDYFENSKVTDSILESNTDVILLPYMNFNYPSQKWIMNSQSIFLKEEYSEVFEVFEMEIQDLNSLGYKAVKNNDKNYLIDLKGCYFDVDSSFVKIIDDSKIVYFTIFDNEYWFSDNGVIKKYSPKTKALSTISNAQYYHYLFFDNERTLWASSQNGGLLKISNLNHNYINLNNHEEVLNVATNQETMLIVSKDEICIVDKDYQILNCQDNVLKKKGSIFSHSGGYSLGSKNSVIEIKGNEFMPIKEYCIGFIKSLFQIEDTIFIGTQLGFDRYHVSDNMSKIKRRPKYFKKGGLVEIEYDSKEEKFILATKDGLKTFDFKSEPKSIYTELNEYSINKILLTDQGVIYVSTNNSGLFKLRNNKIDWIYNESSGLNSNNINDMVIYAQYLYAATNNGLSRVNLKTNDIKTINKYNGLSSSNINHVEVFNDEVVINVEGELYVVDQSEFEKEPIKSRIIVNKFFNNNEIVKYWDNMNFSYDQNKIEIHLQYISLRSGKDKRIEYQIPKVDTSWISTTEQVIRLPALEPGEYEVKARGVNALKQKSDPINISFTINPPWWQTNLARLLGLMGVIGITSLVIRYRSRQTIKKEKVKREYLTQINEIKEQALQLQMNPHFIFNSLNAIQNFIGTDEEQNAINYLARFARMIRLIFEYSKGTKITMEEEVEFMKLYLNLEKLRFQDKVDIQLNVDQNEIDNFDIIMIPPLLIQPIVENSFKHGLFHKKGKGHIKIDYQIYKEKIIVVIEDDGIGRDASTKLSSREKDYKTASGISTTKERLGLLNYNSNNQLNTIKVEDLKDKKGNALGTKTTITLSTK